MPVRIPQWNESELEVIKTHVPVMGCHYTQFTYLPHRTLGEIKAAALDMGIIKNYGQVELDVNYIQTHRPKTWTFEEILVLLRYQPTLSNIEIRSTFLPHKCVTSIARTSSAFGIPNAQKTGTWEDIEIRNLIKYGKGVSLAELQRTFYPYRTLGSIRAKKSHLNVRRHHECPRPKPWSEDEVEYLKANLTDKGFQQIADTLGRSKNSVKAQCQKLGIVQNPNVRHVRWNKQEVEFLKANWTTMTNKELQEKLHRSKSSVHSKKHQLGFE